MKQTWVNCFARFRSSFIPARLVLEEKIIGPMADRRKALELSEAMVLAEELASCRRL